MAGKFEPNNAQNLIEIEKQFAVKAVEQAQTYWNLLEKVNPVELKLTKIDDEIYEDTIKTFPEFAEPPHTKLVKLDEEWMKSDDGKKRWRDFMERSVPFLVVAFWLCVGIFQVCYTSRASVAFLSIHLFSPFWMVIVVWL
ncbi:hypothetical protein EST38_g3079 [Candolleomyces aberdarensis]|uniref:Polysaccharide biosynthesis domain-containing protein n=1 Tax=Candolleomyces aberdarensis TaxID=2316362 RepID=A0A4Q2DV29_9AGAR|nr:hypothetical protein EST38_g3079 [Candolleomyces aberdarensis]